MWEKKKKKSEGKKGDYKGMTSLHLVFLARGGKGSTKNKEIFLKKNRQGSHSGRKKEQAITGNPSLPR